MPLYSLSPDLRDLNDCKIELDFTAHNCGDSPQIKRASSRQQARGVLAKHLAVNHFHCPPYVFMVCSELRCLLLSTLSSSSHVFLTPRAVTFLPQACNPVAFQICSGASDQNTVPWHTPILYLASLSHSTTSSGQIVDAS